MAKRLLAALLSLVVLAGCAVGSSPEKVTAAFLDHLVEGKLSKAEACTLEGSLGLDKKGKSAAAIWKPLFASLQYSVGGAVTDGTTATVNVTIMTIDLEDLMAEASLEVTRQVLSGSAGGEDLYYRLLLEKLTDPDPPMATFSATVTLVKEGRWKIDLASSSDFAEALGGGVEGLLPG